MDSLPRVLPTSATCSAPVIAMPDKSAIIAMARMSSMIRIPRINCAKGSLPLPNSASALTMIVVEEIDSIAPRNMLFMVPQPNHWPIS